MKSASTPLRVGFIDNPHAPQLFADGTSGMFLRNGNIRITLETVKMNHVSTPGPMNRVVIGRIVMPIEQAQSMAREILDLVEQERVPSSHIGGTVQ